MSPGLLFVANGPFANAKPRPYLIRRRSICSIAHQAYLHSNPPYLVRPTATWKKHPCANAPMPHVSRLRVSRPHLPVLRIRSGARQSEHSAGPQVALGGGLLQLEPQRQL